MIRTFTLPSAPFPLYDPSTEEPVKDAKGEAVTLTHREVFRTIILDPRLRSDLDTFELYDLRRKLTADFGACVELDEREHAALLPRLLHPADGATAQATSVLTPGALYSPGVIDLFRSVVNAKKKES